MDFKRIIVSRVDNIGDLVLTLPMVGVIKKFYPQCKIVFIGRSYTRSVIEACEHVDEFMDWDEVKAKTNVAQVEIFRSLKADAIVHVFENNHIASVAKKAKIKNRIGNIHQLFHLWTCNRRVNFSRRKSDLHEAQLNLKLLTPLGINVSYSLSETASFYGLNKFIPLSPQNASVIDKNKFNVIFHPKSNAHGREWSLENYSQTIKLLDPNKFKIFISGTEKEKIILKDWIATLPESVVDLTGKLSLSAFMSFINSADALVASSTGPLHLAAAMGKHAIGLYPPMRPMHAGRWGALGKHAKNLSLEKNCSDCRGAAEKCVCVNLIKANEVAQALESARKN